MITRSNAQALIPDEVSREIVKNVTHRSAVMQLARRLPNMSTNQTKMPVLSGLAEAYWVNGDTGLKQTSESEWSNVYINAEELAVIVPVPEAVIDDASYDIWAEVQPQIEEAMGAAFDAAVLTGLNRPTGFPLSILEQSVAASHTVDLSTTLGAGDDLYDALLGSSGVFSLVEEDGFAVTGSAARLQMRSRLRDLRATTGELIFKQSVQSSSDYTLDGTPIYFIQNQAITDFELIAGDWSKLVWSLRQDITYKILDQAVLTDNAGNIKYNLAQQDMLALRAVMRIGWALPNPASRINSNASTRLPFAALVP